jgi:hypothetical protein
MILEICMSAFLLWALYIQYQIIQVMRAIEARHFKDQFELHRIMLQIKTHCCQKKEQIQYDDIPLKEDS